MTTRFARSIAGRFCRSTDGAYSILAAILATVIVGFTGFAVDLGSIIYAQKRLQSATDLAAMAATFDFNRSESIAETALQANASSDAIVDEAYVGNYVDDPGLPSADRFVAAAPDNAVRLVTRTDVPVHFMRMLTGSPTVSVGASSVAYNLPLAGIAIGTGVADADNDQLDAYEEATTGNYYNLTDAERAALEATRISVFRLLDDFASATGSRDQLHRNRIGGRGRSSHIGCGGVSSAVCTSFQSHAYGIDRACGSDADCARKQQRRSCHHFPISHP